MAFNGVKFIMVATRAPSSVSPNYGQSTSGPDFRVAHCVASRESPRSRVGLAQKQRRSGRGEEREMAPPMCGSSDVRLSKTICIAPRSGVFITRGISMRGRDATFVERVHHLVPLISGGRPDHLQAIRHPRIGDWTLPLSIRHWEKLRPPSFGRGGRGGTPLSVTEPCQCELSTGSR